jgi:hypothetical protein
MQKKLVNIEVSNGFIDVRPEREDECFGQSVDQTLRKAIIIELFDWINSLWCIIVGKRQNVFQ